ncbi:MAG: alpha/beta hydrolase [Roseibium sp.]|uniref:alpha/beta hydrolase n=1 Tax=Roseibium sp. TaxID=1936156 RepID=UPI0026151506|nr:alpha/beta hydrolase [Roseibium sp.]MCV0427974.1 alpha/beta hydrolase [Roseibium sp.]
MSLKPIVFLHGTNAAPWTMAPFSDYFLERGFDCHSPTYRFHDLADTEARSEALKGTSIKDYVDDIADFIGTLDHRPIVIGHSLGGLIAQLLSSRGLIEAGVLINSSIINGTLPTTDMERALGKGFMSAGRFWEEAPGQDFELLAAYGLNTMPEHQQHEICDRLSTESGNVLYELFFWMYDINQTTKVDFSKAKAPLLFLSGTEDKVVPPSTAKTMADRYGDLATFVEIEGRCHYMQLEEGWQDLARRSLTWIQEL